MGVLKKPRVGSRDKKFYDTKKRWTFGDGSYHTSTNSTRYLKPRYINCTTQREFSFYPIFINTTAIRHVSTLSLLTSKHILNYTYAHHFLAVTDLAQDAAYTQGQGHDLYMICSYQDYVSTFCCIPSTKVSILSSFPY